MNFCDKISIYSGFNWRPVKKISCLNCTTVFKRRGCGRVDEYMVLINAIELAYSKDFMLHLLLIAICLGFGMFFRRFDEFRLYGPKILNSLIFNLFLPALILAYIPQFATHYSPETVLYPALMPWVVFIGSAIFMLGLAKIFSKFFLWSKQTTGMLVLVAGLGNTSFLGFPLLEAFYGSQAIATGIVIDQLGSFLIVSTLATAFAAAFSKEKASMGMLVKKLFGFAPFVTLLVSLCLIPFGPFDALSPVLIKLGSPMPALAIISLGLQLNVSVTEVKRNLKEIFAALSYKLLLAPLMIFFLYVHGLKQHGEIAQITVTEMAMAPMFSAAILAARFHLEPELASLITFIGVFASLVTVPIWVFVFLSGSVQ